MRILICHNEYAAPSGEEHAIRALGELLHCRGHVVDFFLRSSTGIRSTQDKVNAFFSGIHSPNAVASLRNVLAVQRPDVAFVQNLYPFLSPSILPLLRRAGIPVVMRCPNYRLFCPNGLFLSHEELCERCCGGHEYWAILRNCESAWLKSIGYAARNATARLTGRIVDNVDYFIVLSQFQRHKFIANGLSEARVKILPNISPPLPCIAEGSASKDLGTRVTFVGRVSPEKGIEDFIAAARMLPNIPFVVVGNYDRMSSLLRQSPTNVTWTGFLAGAALDDAYRSSRILVIPSRCFEGFPNVITRAMMFDRPVIAARIGAIPEIVAEDVTGLLYSPQCVDELVTKIRLLYQDIDRCSQMGLAGHAKAERCYSREVVGRQLDALLTQVLNL